MGAIHPLAGNLTRAGWSAALTAKESRLPRAGVDGAGIVLAGVHETGVVATATRVEEADVGTAAASADAGPRHASDARFAIDERKDCAAAPNSSDNPAQAADACNIGPEPAPE